MVEVTLTGNHVLMIVSTFVLLGITLYYQSRRRPEKPREWRKVGKLAEIVCYPIKSCGGIKLREAECAPLGVKSGMLRDRVFMVVGHDGKFITGRDIPKLTLVQPVVEGSKLTLKGKGMPDVSIDITELSTRATAKTVVWGDEVSTVDCGDEIANWLTRFLLHGEERVLRLVYYPSDVSGRAVRPKNKVFKDCTSEDLGALPDATSYNLITKASLQHLNTFTKKYVSPEAFRGNFVIGGSEAYDEDNWDLVQIGGALFKNVKPCTRCLFTTVNPFTGEKSADQEPLSTLRIHRKVKDPKLIPFTGDSPVFGIHLAVREAGLVEVGQFVYAQLNAKKTK